MLKASPQHLRQGGGYAGSGYGGRYGDPTALAARRRAAESIARKNGLEVVDGWPMPTLGVDCYVMRLSAGLSIEDAIARVSKDPRVAWSEPMQVYQARGNVGGTSDPLLPIEPATLDWRLSDLHKVASGRGITVAIIDSKIDVKHPDLAGHFVANENFLATDAAQPEQHGTAVAGIIGAQAGNGVGIAGIAPDAKLMALRACWQVRSGGTSPPTLVRKPGYRTSASICDRPQGRCHQSQPQRPARTLLAKLISIALARKSTVVAAFDPTLPQGGFPASLPGVIAVADQTLHNLPARVYAAPARDIPTTEPGGRWYLVNGTSYAVAHVSGLLALVRQHRGRIAALPGASGVVDACATLMGTTARCDCSCTLSALARNSDR